MSKENKDRNVRLVRDHVHNKLTLAECGRKYGITRERARQIVRMYEVEPTLTARVRKVDNRNKYYKNVSCKWCNKMQEKLKSEESPYFCDAHCYRAHKKYQTIICGPSVSKQGEHWILRDPITNKSTLLPRYILQMKLGRPLTSNERAKVIDRSKSKYDPDNLEVERANED